MTMIIIKNAVKFAPNIGVFVEESGLDLQPDELKRLIELAWKYMDEKYLCEACHGGYNILATRLGWDFDEYIEIIEDLGINNRGFIYVLNADPYYKIGLTKRTPEKRLAEISPKMPFEPSLCLSYQSSDVYEEEAFLHEQFADKRVNGEWFELTDDDIEYIAKRGGIK
jgi:hypothetical protein